MAFGGSGHQVLDETIPNTPDISFGSLNRA
jgi:hypothetical protein